MTSNSKDISTLNTLIATLIDSIDGYLKSAEDIHNAGFGEMFRARAQERQAVVEQLRRSPPLAAIQRAMAPYWRVRTEPFSA